MAEIPSAQPTTDLHFADGGTAVVSEPAEGDKSSGYVSGEEPLAPEMNWVLREGAKKLQWATGDYDGTTPLAGAIKRRFGQLDEAIAATYPNTAFPAAALERFLVEAGAPDVLAGANQWSINSPNSTNPVDVATDGRYVLIATASAVYLRNASDGSAVWGPITPNASNITCCALDGANAWVGTNNDGAADEVFKLSLDDGSTVDSTACGGGNNVEKIASNGVVVIWMHSGNVLSADVASGLTGTPDTYTHGANVRNCALDSTQAYLVGDDDAGDAGEVLRALDITGGGGGGGSLSQNWDLTAGGADAVLDVISDDMIVYIVGAFNGVNVQALEKTSGGSLWTASLTGAQSVCVDHTRLYVAISTGAAIPQVEQYNKLTGGTGPGVIPGFGTTSRLPNAGVATADGVRNIACDGMTVFSANTTATPASSNTIFRRDCRRGSQEYRRAAATDDARNPFHNTAIPVGSSRPW